jgi:putative peptidoglycan lipid II flippase
MIRSSAIYSGLTLVSRLMGFVRDLVISYFLGASSNIAADALNTAQMFPNLFRRIFAEGAFAAAFVPAYSKSLDRDGPEIADRLAGDAMATIAAFTVALTLVAQLAMPWLMMAISPGFGFGTEKYKLAVILTQITMPYLPCMAIVALLSGVLNARGKFIVAGAAPILLNLVTLIAVIPSHGARQAAVAVSWGIFAAGICQVLLLVWAVRKAGATIQWRLPRLTPEIKGLIALAVPGAIAASASQINITVSGILASQVNGARTWLAYADRLYQLPLGLVGVAIGVALLPRLSRAVVAEDRRDAQTAMDQAIVFALALSLPAAVALFSIPYFLIDGLFTRGEFTAFDARATADALMQYGWGTPAFVLARILSPAFFARGDTKGPMRFALISVAANIVLGLALFPVFGVAGLAAATSAASWLNVLQMTVVLGRRGDYSPSPAAWGKIVRVLAASAALGLILAALSHWRPAIEAPILALGLGSAKELAILATCGLAALVYPALLLASGGVTLAEARTILRRGRGG